jgi:hypothetical protein
MGINFGIHTINVVEFRKEIVYTNESNKQVQIWNHTIKLEPLTSKRTKYIDIVVVCAGFKTFFIWLWANVFYRHRQR